MKRPISNHGGASRRSRLPRGAEVMRALKIYYPCESGECEFFRPIYLYKFKGKHSSNIENGWIPCDRCNQYMRSNLFIKKEGV
jgi:hypothetical protein